MAFYNCKLIRGGKMPDTITITGGSNIRLNPSIVKGDNTDPTIAGNNSVTLPSFGYHYADVVGDAVINELSGNNIDISQESTITISVTGLYKNGGYYMHLGTTPYGGVDRKWTITLHN